jgi:hypothetical protein
VSWASGASFPESNQYSTDAADATKGFGDWRGRPVDAAVFWPNRGSWASFILPNSLYSIWASQPYLKVITLPIFPRHNGDSASGCIAGEYNDEWRTFARTMKETGLAAEGSVIRLGWEFNLHKDWGTPAEFAACWRDIVSTVRTIAPGLRWDWNVNRGTGAGMPGDDVLGAYPGDGYVDIIGIDGYDAWPPATVPGGWQQQLNGPYALNYWLAFARAHGKKLSVPEWAVASPEYWPGHAGGDDPGYIDDMYDFFRSCGNTLAYESYFNGPGSSISNPDQNPDAAQEYRKLWSMAG